MLDRICTKLYAEIIVDTTCRKDGGEEFMMCDEAKWMAISAGRRILLGGLISDKMLIDLLTWTKFMRRGTLRSFSYALLLHCVFAIQDDYFVLLLSFRTFTLGHTRRTFSAAIPK